jgi:hypothetical protein
LKPKIVELPSHKSSPPHCCIVSGRRDGPIVDFGDPTDKACGPTDPRVYLRGAVIEDVAINLLGMRPKVEVDELEQQLGECDAERQRLAAIVAGSEELSAAEDKLRAALGVSREDPGDGQAIEENRG